MLLQHLVDKEKCAIVWHLVDKKEKGAIMALGC